MPNSLISLYFCLPPVTPACPHPPMGELVCCLDHLLMTRLCFIVMESWERRRGGDVSGAGRGDTIG